MHVAGLRSCIENPKPLPAGGHSNAALLCVRKALGKVLEQHASRRWCSIVPLRILQAVFPLATQRYAMIPGRQSDAMDCFRLFYDSLGGALQEACWLTPPDQMLRYPVGIEEGVHISMGQLLEVHEKYLLFVSLISSFSKYSTS